MAQRNRDNLAQFAQKDAMNVVRPLVYNGIPRAVAHMPDTFVFSFSYACGLLPCE